MINNHLIIDAMAMQQVKARYDEAEKTTIPRAWRPQENPIRHFPSGSKTGARAMRRYTGFMRKLWSAATSIST